LPQRGSAFTRWIGRVMLAMIGYKVIGQFPSHPKLILLGTPHTSNWDLLLAMGMRFATGAHYNWMMKKEAFVWPFGPLWKRMGGIPIDRKAAQDVTQQTADWFNASEAAYLGITPSGTRAKIDRYKKGYLRIAHAANVPVFICGVDSRRKALVLDKVWPLTGDIDADNAEIKAYIDANYSGIKPANG